MSGFGMFSQSPREMILPPEPEPWAERRRVKRKPPRAPRRGRAEVSRPAILPPAPMGGFGLFGARRPYKGTATADLRSRARKLQGEMLRASDVGAVRRQIDEILDELSRRGEMAGFGGLGAGSSCAASHEDLRRLKSKVDEVHRALDILVRR